MREKRREKAAQKFIKDMLKLPADEKVLLYFHFNLLSFLFFSFHLFFQINFNQIYYL
jgi:hypothetical protein